jgi:hypothetical protein
MKKTVEVKRQVFELHDGETWWVYAKDIKDAVKTIKKIGDFDFDDSVSFKTIPKKDWKKLKCHNENRTNSVSFDKLILANEFLNGERSFLLACTIF